MTVRIAMIGAGAMANRVHYPSLASFDDVEIAAICDVAPQALNVTADRYGVERRNSNYRQMIEEVAPDGVYAIGQPHIMYDVWTWCLRAAQNLFIEKPMGLTWHQAQMLATLAEQHGVITQVGHQRRTNPLLVKLRRACTERGAIVHAVCEFYKFGPKAYLEARDRMLDDCTHSIDTIRWACGGEVVGIESHCKRIGTPDINWIGATRNVENGSSGYVLNSWCTGRRVFRVEMHAAGIYADAVLEDKGILFADDDHSGIEFDAREVAGSDEFFIYGGFQAKNREFIDSIKTGQHTTSSPFRDALKTMQVAEKILAAAVLNGE